MSVEKRMSVRRSGRADIADIVRLMEMNGLPRWTAYEEGSFLVAGGGGRDVIGVVAFREVGAGRMLVGVPVVDPWFGESETAVALYVGAAESAGVRGLREVVLVGRVSSDQAREAGFQHGLRGWWLSFGEAPGGGFGRLRKALGKATIPGL
ncbi:hypothetical protein [Rubrobacter indicoceani]|uniref:hypothetical protein n=1 Tax=Rubrobacter indicoceani TaxID=2051957 RepID=UPI0013C4E57B|nr:hypothetical protein [Rubrobacter indicoceani]